MTSTIYATKKPANYWALRLKMIGTQSWAAVALGYKEFGEFHKA